MVVSHKLTISQITRINSVDALYNWWDIWLIKMAIPITTHNIWRLNYYTLQIISELCWKLGSVYFFLCGDSITKIYR